MLKKAPTYSLHKPSGQARVRIDSKTFYLGVYDSPESHARYEQIIAKWYARTLSVDSESLTIERLSLMFIEHALSYYRKDGVPTSEVHSIRTALRPLVAKCGGERVNGFGPRRLKDVRDEMIRLGWTRTGINSAVRRINRMLRWAVENELIDSRVYETCKAISGLRRGRSAATEPDPVKPAASAAIEAIKSHVGAEVWAMIQVQLVTGMRPGEVCIMRRQDIDRSGPVWKYIPYSHKTEHHGRARIVFLGPKAQTLIQPFIDVAERQGEEYLFSPRRAELQRNAIRRSQRRSVMTSSQMGRLPKESPERAAGDHYRRDSYSRAIARACKLAKIEVWSPNQLRHNAATEFRKNFGLEAARTVLGHTEANTTLFYAETDWELAEKAVKDIG